MPAKLLIPQKVAAILVYGRPPLVFGGMLCAIAVMWNRSPNLYTLGVVLLFTAMAFDLVDGWFAARFSPNMTLAHLADRIMDKIVYSIIFPLVAVGVMWRLMFISPAYTKGELLHAIFILLLCITVLIRDDFAQFMRGFAERKGQEPELIEFTRLRTIVAAPVGALLYAHAFYIPEGPPAKIYFWISWLGNLPVRGLFLIEIVFLIINFGSIAGYCRKYGSHCLDDLCLGDELLRRKILAFFPNALTVMNAIMGLLAVFFSYQGRIREAYLFLLGAAFFDRLDGALARRLGLTEPLPDLEHRPGIGLGSILDDLSDAVSFCIAPAWIFYVVVEDYANPLTEWLPLGLTATFYALAGIARLVYFTLDRHPIPGFFKGLPTPAGALLVVPPLVIFSQAVQEGSPWASFWGGFCFAVILLAGFMMNLYPVRYLHLGRLMGRKPWLAWGCVLVLLGFMFTPFFGHIALFYMVLYLLSPLVTGGIDPDTAAKEHHAEQTP